MLGAMDSNKPTWNIIIFFNVPKVSKYMFAFQVCVVPLYMQVVVSQPRRGTVVFMYVYTF